MTSTVDGRRLSLSNVFNFRDIGGHPSAGGREVTTGSVFRADGLNRLDEGDIEIVSALELRTIIDLRTDVEREEHGVAPADALSADLLHLPLIHELWPREGADLEHPVDYLVARYLEMTEDVGGRSIAQIVELAGEGDPDSCPLVFHCSAGKDRTGVTAAVLLALAGVDDETIAADYHLTAAAVDDFTVWIHEHHPEAADAMTEQPKVFMTCPPEAMFGFLAGVRERHGSVEGLVRDLGVSDSTVRQLRQRLITDN
jgi:protein-tyrosine phosphatase